jgi:hypothetical protein
MVLKNVTIYQARASAGMKKKNHNNMHKLSKQIQG